MTTQQVADRLVELCRKGEIFQAQEELYGDNILCIEPEHSPTAPGHKGSRQCLQKGKMFAIYDRRAAWRFIRSDSPC